MSEFYDYNSHLGHLDLKSFPRNRTEHRFSAKVCQMVGYLQGTFSFSSKKTLYILHNSLIFPLRILAKYTFPVLIFFSNIGIDLYSFYRKNLIVTPKIRQKIDRSPYSFTRKRRFISLAG